MAVLESMEYKLVNANPRTSPQLEVSIEHIPRTNGIECYNYSSSADSATPRD